jgi:hypothetical protein
MTMGSICHAPKAHLNGGAGLRSSGLMEQEVPSSLHEVAPMSLNWSGLQPPRLPEQNPIVASVLTSPTCPGVGEIQAVSLFFS